MCPRIKKRDVYRSSRLAWTSKNEEGAIPGERFDGCDGGTNYQKQSHEHVTSQGFGTRHTLGVTVNELPLALAWEGTASDQGNPELPPIAP
jgi:hypothetical protein